MSEIIQVVGFQNSGKTTFVERLLHHFKVKQLSVGVIKHHGHTDTLDLHRDKDTGILFHAGADLVIGSSQTNSEILMRQEMDVDASVAYMRAQGIQKIIIEGYKTVPHPKIVLLSKQADMVLLSQLENIIGVYCTHGFSLPKDFSLFNLTAEEWCEKLTEEIYPL